VGADCDGVSLVAQEAVSAACCHNLLQRVATDAPDQREVCAMAASQRPLNNGRWVLSAVN
jgi:hypothetical protein